MKKTLLFILLSNVFIFCFSQITSKKISGNSATFKTKQKGWVDMVAPVQSLDSELEFDPMNSNYAYFLRTDYPLSHKEEGYSVMKTDIIRYDANRNQTTVLVKSCDKFFNNGSQISVIRYPGTFPESCIHNISNIYPKKNGIFFEATGWQTDNAVFLYEYSTGNIIFIGPGSIKSEDDNFIYVEASQVREGEGRTLYTYAVSLDGYIPVEGDE